MYESNIADRLIKSEKWRQFLESTAAALKINITFYGTRSTKRFSVCCQCPSCGCRLQEIETFILMDGEGLIPAGDIKTQELEYFRLDENYSVAVRDYACCRAGNGMAFPDKIKVARELLTNFYDILINQLYEGQIETELTTLHQINHIVLSMFRGDEKALERVIDLILSAAVILFDASSSWFDYTVGGQHYMLTKGDRSPSGELTDIQISKTVTAEVHSPVISGTLGIMSPVDLARANKFLDFMANECVIVFEIEKLLKLMESKLTVILNAVDALVLLVDRRKNICYANKAAATILNRQVHELLTLPVCEIDAPWCQSILEETEITAKGIKDMLLCASDERFIDWEVYPLTGAADIPGWVIIARECTDYYRLQELGERTENLVHASTLLRVIAHEIRNPIATFKGLLQVIDLKSGTPEISKYVNIGMNEIRKLTLLLDEFNQLGKMAETSLEATDLKPYMEEVYNLVTAGFNGPDIRIESSFRTVRPVLADKRQLTQAIFNLVKNAYEALNRKGKISLFLNQYDEDWVEIKVCDDGQGISESIKDKLFKPYFSTKADGTGLGLAIVNTIVSNHNGKISVHNMTHGGACFSIQLPVYHKPGSPASEEADILLLTDNEIIRLPSERLFKEEGIRYFSIGRRDSVFTMIERCKPRALLIDDDFLNVHILKKLIHNIVTDYPNMKILIAGSRVVQAERNICLVGKPLNYAKLVDTVKSILL